MVDQAPRPSRISRWIRVTAVVLAGMAALWVGALFALSRLLDPEAVAAWVEPRLEEALNHEVEIARVEVGLLPLGVRLQDVTVADPTGLSPALLRVRSLDLRVRILPLLHRQVQVSRLVLDGTDADFRIDANGTSNFGDFSTRGPGGDEAGISEPEEAPESPGSKASSFTLNLEDVRVTGGQVRYADARSSLAAELDNFRVRAAVRGGEEGSWILTGETEGVLTAGRGGSTPLLDAVASGATFDLTTGPAFEQVEIESTRLHLGELALTLSGSLGAVQDPVRTVSLAMSAEGLPVTDALDLLPDTVRRRIPFDAEGTFGADLELNGRLGPGTVPDVAGQLRLRNGGLAFRGEPFAEDASADLSLAAERSIQTRLTATLLGGPLEVEGIVSLAERGSMDLSLQADPDLSRVGSSPWVPEGTATSGHLGANVRITGDPRAPTSLRLDGEVLPKTIRISTPSLDQPLQLPEGRIRLEGSRAVVAGLPIQLGEDRISLSGEVSDLFAFANPEAVPQLRLNVRGSRLDLTKLTPGPPPDSALTYGRVAFASIGGRNVGPWSATEAAREAGWSRPEALPLAGSLDISLDTLIDRQGRMEDLRATLEFGPSFARVLEASFGRYGGQIRAAANVSLGTDPSAPFSLRLEAEDVSAAAFLTHNTPLGRLIVGRLSLGVDLAGSLDPSLLPERSTLLGSGTFTIRDGGIAPTPVTRSLAGFLGVAALENPSIRDWQTSFLLQDGKMQLGQASIGGFPGEPLVEGSIGLDGSLDLQSVFRFARDRLDTSTLERLGIAGQLAAEVTRRPEEIGAVLHVRGSVTHPSIEADATATAEALRQAVEQGVRGEIRDRVDEQRAEAQQVLDQQKSAAQQRIEEQRRLLEERATGFLRGLNRQRDTARADTLRPGTLRPDSAQPDTIRSDTTGPDTIRPDTTRPDTTRPDTTRPDTIRPDTIKPSTTPPGIRSRDMTFHAALPTRRSHRGESHPGTIRGDIAQADTSSGMSLSGHRHPVYPGRISRSGLSTILSSDGPAASG